MILGEYFIERVYKEGFSTVLNKKVGKARKAEKKNFLDEFLKNVLVYSSQHKKYPLVSEICSVIMDKESNAMQIFEKEGTYKEVVSAIIHFKDNKKHRALQYAKLNHQLMNGLALLHLEKVAHGNDNRKKALLCIRDDDDDKPLDPWLTESYQTIHPSVGWPTQISTLLKVAFTLIPSIILVYFDLYTDFISCINYGYIAFDNSTEIEQACLSQLESKSCLVDGNYSCYDTDDKLSFASRIFTNGTCDESNYWTPCIKHSAETIGLQYLVAFVFMLIISILSWSSYFGILFITKVNDKLPFDDKLPSEKNPLLTRIWWLLSKLFWPLSYAREVYKYRLDTEFKKTEELEESKKSWKLLKNLENGFENYFQILLQLYLLSPYLRSLNKLPLRDLVNWDNFISTFSVPNVFCSQQNIQAALGKLLLSTISLSIGLSSRQATREGEPFGQSVKNLVLALSYFFLCYARIISILPLFSLENPIIALSVFTIVHTMINFLTLWCTKKPESFNNALNENNNSEVSDSTQTEDKTNAYHVDESSATNGYLLNETNGYLSAETNDYLSTETSGYLSTETNGYLSAETNDYLSTETSGYLLTETNDYLSTETNGYLSTETNSVTVPLQSEYNRNACNADESSTQNGCSSTETNSVTVPLQSEYNRNVCHVDESHALNGCSSTETNSVTVNIPSENIADERHIDESSALNDYSSSENNGEEVNQAKEDETNDSNQFLRNCFLHSETAKMVMSCLASHTFIITFNAKSGKKSLVKQTLFQCSILLENLVLLLLPAMFPMLYPDKDCYNFDLKEVRFAFSMWVVGIILQVSQV